MSVTRDVAVEVQAAVPSPLHAASAVYPKVVGADRLWAGGVDGEGITVAVVDTGVAKVADLSGRLIGGVDFSGGGDPYRDDFGHGTFVAGLIAGNGASSGGQYKGVAPKAKLVSIKIAGADGASDVSHVLAAMQWAVSFRADYGIRVLNLSLGTDSTQTYHLSPLNAAVERAWDSGIVVTVSSSNNGPGAGTVTKPGDDPLVITVGALDDAGTPGRGDDVMAGFSGQGPTVADGLTKPDLVASGRSVISLRAPGSAIDDAYPGSRVGSAYFKGSGTSFSTAVTSGAAALLLEREPGLTPDQVKARLLGTAGAGPVGDPNVDGRGSLDAYAAAHAGTYESANVGVPRSLGTGSLNLDRGSLQVQIQLDGLLGALLSPVLQLLFGTDLTAQNQLFDSVDFLTTEWSGTRWYESQWSGTRWYGIRWYGTRWYGTRWYTTEWYGTRWYGIAWEYPDTDALEAQTDRCVGDGHGFSDPGRRHRVLGSRRAGPARGAGRLHRRPDPGLALPAAGPAPAGHRGLPVRRSAVRGMALLLPPLGIVLSFGVSALVSQLIRRRPVERIAFNTGVQLTATGVALAVMRLAGPHEGVGPLNMALVVGAAAVWLIINSAFVWVVLAIVEGQSVWQSARDSIGFRLTLWSSMVAIGLLCGLATSAYPWAVLLAILPLAVLEVMLAGSLRARHERQQLDQLLVAAAAAHSSVEPDDVEEAVLASARELLACRQARIGEVPPGDGELGSRLPGSSYPERWLVVADRRGVEPFGDHDVTLLEALAGVTASALRNASLVEQLKHEAFHDALTGLPNLLLFEETVSLALAERRQPERKLAVFVLDLDRFKRVNDSLGHPAGNELLREVARRLTAVVRTGDTVARMSGDEFTVLVTGLRSKGEAGFVAEKVMAVFQAPFEIAGQELYVTPSIGIAVAPDDGTRPSVLLKNADTAMYRAKERGRNCCEIYSVDMNSAAEGRLALEGDLHQALNAGQLRVVYQPQFDLSTGRLMGVEALARWEHPLLGPVAPDAFTRSRSTGRS